MRRMHWEQLAEHLRKCKCSQTTAKKIFQAIVKQEGTPAWVTAWLTSTNPYFANRSYAERYEGAENAKRRWAHSLKEYETRFLRWVANGPPKSRAFPTKKLLQIHDLLQKHGKGRFAGFLP